MKIRNKKHAFAAIALGAFVTCSATAVRADDTAAEIRLLKARLQQLEAKVAKQEREQKANVHNAAAPPALVCKDGPCPTPPPPPPPVFVSFKNGLFVETLDHAFSFKIGGRLQVDGGGSSQPELGKSGNAGIRRARLEVEGKAFSFWLYKLQYDFTGSTVTGTVQGGIRDAWIALKHPYLDFIPYATDPLTLQVGNSKEPQGLETVTSNKYSTFIERAMVSDALAPSRHVGFAAIAHGKDWSVKGGIYTTSPEDRALAPVAGIPVPFGIPPTAGWVATGGGQYFDLTGRATYAPIKTEDAFLHLGGSIRYHRPNDSIAATDPISLAPGNNIRSEANILGEGLLGTPDLSCGLVPSPNGAVGAALVAGKCVKDALFYGAELSTAYGPFSMQAEYLGAHYDRNLFNLAFARRSGVFAPGGASHDFNGYYVYGTVFLTGETRASSYKVHPLDGAIFEQVKILHPFSAGGWGAWEVGARFSVLNLNSSPITGAPYSNILFNASGGAPVAVRPVFVALANSGVVGGREENLTVGLNWYPDKGVRFMANWVRVMNLSAPFAQPFVNGAHPNIFLMRAQVDW
ncbi:MAG: porin [Methylocystis sp.]|nr:porin [Methylocystis sp.]MBI3274409.1 porin [Methylocystis sp.]